MMKKIMKIIGAVMGPKKIALYVAPDMTGASKVYHIARDDPQSAAILEAVQKNSKLGEITEIEVNLLPHQQRKDNHEFSKIMESTNGAVRFLQISKASIDNLLSKPPAQNDIEDLIANALQLSTQSLTELEDVVAVVRTYEGRLAVIPKQTSVLTVLSQASSVGLMQLYTRLASIVNMHPKSVLGILRFMAEGGLSITDDGSFIAYKALKRAVPTSTTPGGKELAYVDIYTKRVFQDVGTIVCMPSELVNSNCNVGCGQGLHVASSGYLRRHVESDFFLVQIEPEDIIAVPQVGAAKMRVCAYQILDRISDKDFRCLHNRVNFSLDSDLTTQLQKAISGSYPPPVCVITIHEPKGRGLVVRDL